MIDTVYILWIMTACLVLYIFRVVQGPSIWDRLHGFSLISTKILILIVLFAFQENTAYLLDIAIVYALLGFIGIIFTALFLYTRIKGNRN